MDSWFWKEKRKKLHIVKDIVKHHFIHLSCHPSIHPSSHPFVLSWSIYSDGAEKEWNTDATRRRKQQEEMAHMPKPCNDGTDGWNNVSHPFGHPSILSWFVYSDGVEKEWNTNMAWRRIIYISVVNFYFYFYFLFWGFWT